MRVKIQTIKLQILSLVDHGVLQLEYSSLKLYAVPKIQVGRIVYECGDCFISHDSKIYEISEILEFVSNIGVSHCFLFLQREP